MHEGHPATAPDAEGDLASRALARVATLVTAWKSRTSRSHLIAWFYICGFLVAAMIVAGTALMLANLRDRHLIETTRELQNLALTLAEQMDRSFNAVELVQRSLSDPLESLRFKTVQEFEQRVSAHGMYLTLKDKISGLPYIAALTFISAEGKLLNSSLSWPTSAVDVADREYFTVLKSDLLLTSFIGRPVLNRALDTWTIHVARAVRGSNNQLLGLVLAAMELRHFEQSFAAITLLPGSSITLQRDDGVLFARHPPVNATVGATFTAFLLPLAKADRATIRLISQIDAKERIVTARRLPHYPLFITVGVEVGAALAAWREGGLSVLAATAALIIVIGVLIFVGGHRVAARLRGQNLQFDAALTNMSQGLVMFDRDQRVVVTNQRYLDMYGLSAGQVKPGTTLRDLLQHRVDGGSFPTGPPPDPYIAELLASLARGSTWAKVTELPDGRFIAASNRAMPGGGWVATHEDITERRRVESLNSAILESSLDCLIVIDHEGKIVEFNPAAETTFGTTRDQALGKLMVELIVPPRLRAAHCRGFAHYLATGEGPVLGKRLELHAIRSDGNEFPIELTITAIGPASIPLFTGFIRDITARKEAEEKIQRLNRVYAVLSGINALIVRVRDRDELFRESCRLIVDAGRFSLAWIAVTDRDTMKLNPVAWHGAEQGFVDLVRDQLSLKDPPARQSIQVRAVMEKRAFVSEDVRDDPKIKFKQEHAQFDSRSVGAFPIIVGDGVAAVLVLHTAEVGFFDDDEMKLLRDLSGDIAFALEHIRKSEQVDYLAYFDVLTGLANRMLFRERLEQKLIATDHAQGRVAVFLLDLERFKSINDGLGRHAGDELLKQVAQRLVSIGGDATRFGRIGADHFAIFSADVENEQQVARYTEQLLRSVFGPPFRVDVQELRVGTKCGIAMFPADGTDADTLLRNAEVALEKAKSSGERYVFFAQEMTERVAEKLSLENKLRQALERDEFVLYYQPKVDLENRSIVGVEALIRWQSPELGLVLPLKFISLLEETGLILEVGTWALKRAALDHRRWIEQKLKAPRVAVNVSQIQLRQRDFVQIVEQAIIGDVVPTGIDLEVTESLVMEDIENNIEKLEAVRKLGVKIAIDDFGTGYSSLAYLAKLPLETLKIDRVFISTMLDDPNSSTLVQSMISLAHSLRLKVVAEGVETEEQAKMLQQLHCDEMQGFLFSEAVPFDVLTARLKKNQNERPHMRRIK